MTQTVAIFGYGSLLYEPELPDALIEARPARLPGYKRAFNKVSWRRGCRADEAEPVPGVPERFVEGGLHLSLCLGTEPGDGIDGMVLLYPGEIERELLAALDRREGYTGDTSRDHYVRTLVDVGMPAWTWLTNPRSPHYVTLDLAEQARVLLHATPGRCCIQTRALGVHYLDGTRRALAEAGILDPELEALAEQVERIRQEL